MAPIIAAASGALVVYQWAVARPLWLDEELIALNIRERGLLALGGRLSFGQSAPYGWLTLERLVAGAFGTGERALRFVPMVFGLAAIATALWIGRRWLSPIAASTLVLMVALGQWVSYSYVELKQYSADTCGALLLPALAVWAIEADRVAVWWIVATVAQFAGNGPLFVTPACALLIIAATWRRRGLRAAVAAAAPGLLWLALFAVNDFVVLRPAESSAFLQSYWQSEFPPHGAGAIPWFGARLAAFAQKPGGTRLGVFLWIAAFTGFALSDHRRRLLSVAFGLVPLSAFALATTQFVPFFERLVLWVVPSLYVGVALLAACPASGVPLATGIALALVFSGDIAWVGLNDLRARPRDSHHRLDDRSAVRWLAARRQPGDVWVTTHLAAPAIWWYASDQEPILEVRDVAPGGDCHPDALERALQGEPRAMVFLGFRFDDVPADFDDILLRSLGDLGQITVYRGFADATRVAIVDRRLTPRHDRPMTRATCLGVELARRW